jgi:uncharacterized membrane protein
VEFYLPIKLLHILSSTVLFGTGLGTAFFMWRADRSGDLTTIASTARSVVLADGVFTAPAVIIQPVSGAIMIYLSGLPLSTHWVLLSIVLYLLVGALWIPVVWIQLRVARMATEAEKKGTDFHYPHRAYMRWWYSLGWPAFMMVMGIFYMMVFKPL